MWEFLGLRSCIIYASVLLFAATSQGNLYPTFLLQLMAYFSRVKMSIMSYIADTCTVVENCNYSYTGLV